MSWWHIIKYMSIGCTYINSSVIINIMKTIKLTLPYPPTVNHYWGQLGSKKFLGKKGKEFREAVFLCSYNARKGALNERLHMEVYLYPPDNRKRDVDNILKPLLDALEHANVYENDSQIDKLCVTRMPVTKGGMCDVVISEINACPQPEVDTQ
jgi:crossover junction endodeoxyribonuclease RusA